MTKVTISNKKAQEITFEDLALGDAYYTLNYPDIPCIKVTNELCLFYDTDFQKWDYTDENPTEPVCKIDAEIKFMY